MANGRIILMPGERGLPRTNDLNEFATAVVKLINGNPHIKTKATIANAVRVRFNGHEGCVQLPFGGKALTRKAARDALPKDILGALNL